jgi:hypothetical protein
VTDRAVQPEAPTPPHLFSEAMDAAQEHMGCACGSLEGHLRVRGVRLVEARAASQERPQPITTADLRWLLNNYGLGSVPTDDPSLTDDRLADLVVDLNERLGVAQERPQPTTNLTSVSTSLVVQWREAFEAHDEEHQGIGGLHPESCDEWIANRAGVAQERPQPIHTKHDDWWCVCGSRVEDCDYLQENLRAQERPPIDVAASVEAVEQLMWGYDWLGTGGSSKIADDDEAEGWFHWNVIRAALGLPRHA